MAPNGDWRKYGQNHAPEQDYDHDDHGFPDTHPHDENGGHYHDWEGGVRGPAHAFSWDTFWGGLLAAGCLAAIVVVAVDDSTGIGVADDWLVVPLGEGVAEGIIMLFGE